MDFHLPGLSTRLTEATASEAAVAVEWAILGRPTPRQADAQRRLLVHWEPSAAIESHGLGLVPSHEVVVLAHFLRQVAVARILRK